MFFDLDSYFMDNKLQTPYFNKYLEIFCSDADIEHAKLITRHKKNKCN